MFRVTGKIEGKKNKKGAFVIWQKIIGDVVVEQNYLREEGYGTGDIISGFRKENLRDQATTVTTVQIVENKE